MDKFKNTIIAVDCDGTVVTHDYPRMGRDIGAGPVLRRLTNNGAKLILWTMRSGEQLQDAVDWFIANGIPLFGINNNPQQSGWTSSPKVYAHIYVDDAGISCPLIHDDSHPRPYVDWKRVEQLLFPDNPLAQNEVES